MTKKKFIIISLVFVLGFLILVGYRINEKRKLDKKISEAKPNATSVSIVLAKKGSISEFFSTTGTVISEKEVNVTPKATGRILTLLVDEGIKVSKGQVIAEIEHTELDAQISQAKAQINVSKANLDLLVTGPLDTQITQTEALAKQADSSLAQVKINLDRSETDIIRYSDLKKQGAITAQQFESYKSQNESLKKQYESAKQQVVSSRAALKTLKDGNRKEQINAGRGQFEQSKASLSFLESQLANYYVKSPLNGVVTKKFLEVGSMVGGSSPIVTISKVTQPELEMNIPEKQILKIKLNQLVEMESTAFPDKKIKIKIKEISPVVDTQTRLIKVKGIINSELPLKIGMMFDCKVSLKEDTNSLILPSEALLMSENKKYVYLFSNGKAVEKIVKIGIQTPDEVQVLEGITESDKVITKGNTFIKSGDPIELAK